MKRQVTITISFEDVQNYFNCPMDKALEIWDEIDETHDLEETMESEVMATFNAILSRYIRSK